MQPLLQWKGIEYFAVCVCICSLRYPACNVHAPYYHLWPALFWNVFSHFLLNGTFFFLLGWWRLLNMKFVFWISLQLCLKYFSFWEELSERWSKMYIGLDIKYPLLSSFNESWILLTCFQKILKYKISWKSFQWEPNCTIRTDGLDKANSYFLQFCKCA